MNWLYLASSIAAVVYLLLTIYRLRIRVPSTAVALALMLAVHGSNILWVIVTHKQCDGWDVVFNVTSAALTFGFVCIFKKRQRA